MIKFSQDGKFVLQIGTPGKMEGPESHDHAERPAGVAVDDAANEVYVADSGNKRIVVFDANTGAYKRTGATGESRAAGATTAVPPAVPSSCVQIAKDGMVYVCDSANNRIQVFQKDGKFVKEGVVKEGTGGFVLGGAGGAQGTTYSFGSVWDIAFSNDPSSGICTSPTA